MSGYYPDNNVEINNLPQHGFGTVNNWQQTGHYSVKTACLLSAATGVIFNLLKRGNTKLYLGIYTDHALNNMQTSAQAKNIVSYNAQGLNVIEANSVLASGQVNRAKLFNEGIQLKIGFGAFRSGTKRVKHAEHL